MVPDSRDLGFVLNSNYERNRKLKDEKDFHFVVSARRPKKRTLEAVIEGKDGRIVFISHLCEFLDCNKKK
jgi:hypothetical protein